jgi:hypothetical protein
LATFISEAENIVLLGRVRRCGAGTPVTQTCQDYGRAIAQVVSCRLPTTAARVRNWRGQFLGPWLTVMGPGPFGNQSLMLVHHSWHQAWQYCQWYLTLWSTNETEFHDALFIGKGCSFQL